MSSFLDEIIERTRDQDTFPHFARKNQLQELASLIAGFIQEPLMGVWMDFESGAEDIDVTARDMGTPTRIDSVTVGTGATLKYKDPTVLSSVGLPRIVEAITTGAQTAYITVNHSRATVWDWYGRLYINMPALPPNSLQFVKWFEETITASGARQNVEKCRAQITSSGKLEIRNNANTLLKASTLTLAANVPYRFEWFVVRGSSTGTVAVSIYLGNDSVPLETVISSPSDTGAGRIVQTRFGNTNNANIGTVRFGGFADGLRDPAGPYTGPPDLATVLFRDPDGVPLVAIDHEGCLTCYAGKTIQYDSDRQKIYRGDPLVRFDIYNAEIQYGLNRNSAKNHKGGSNMGFGPSYLEGGYNIPSQRAYAGMGFNCYGVGDPVDFTGERAEDLAPERQADDGEILASGFFRSGLANFHVWEKGKVITITHPNVVGNDNVLGTPRDAWIGNIVDERTVLIEDRLGTQFVWPVASGLHWQMVGFPYPDEVSGAQGAIVQVRSKPTGFKFIRDHAGANDATIVAGTDIVNVPSGNFTQEDLTRGFNLADDALRTYRILAVNSLTQIQLDRVDAIGGAGLAWAMCGGVNDPGVTIQFNPTTIGQRIDQGVMIFDQAQTKVVARRSRIILSGADPGIMQGGGNNFQTPNILEGYDGDAVFPQAGKGVVLTSPNGNVQRRLSIDNAGAIVLTAYVPR